MSTSKISFPGLVGGGGGSITIPTGSVDTPEFIWFGFHPSGQSGVAWRASPPANGDTVVVATSADNWSTSGTMTDSTAGSGNNRTAQGHTLLDADTTYEYRVLNQGALVTSGSFNTAPASGVATDFTVLFGACQSGFVYDNLIFNTASGEGATLFLHLGDLGYTDIANVTAQAAISRQLFTPESTWVSGIIRNMQWAGIWDDHDFGGNNEDRAHNGIQVMSSGWKNFYPHNELPDTSGALYRKFPWGDVEFFLLDQRFWRDVNTTAATWFPDVNGTTASGGTTTTQINFDDADSPSTADDFYNGWYVNVSGNVSRIRDYVGATRVATLTRPIADLTVGAAVTVGKKSLHNGRDNSSGEDQVDWLASGVLNSACTWKVIVSPTTWNPSTAYANNDPFSEHDGSGLEYTYLVQQLSGVVSNIILIEGDTHFGAIDDGTTSPFPTIMAGPLQAGLGSEEGTWSEGTTVTSGVLNYGKIAFSGTDAILSVIQESGNVVMTNTVTGVIPLAVDDASVSGELRMWFNNTSLSLATPGQSGLDFWDDLSQTANDYPDRNTPSVASGEINGLDVAYCSLPNKNFFETAFTVSQLQGTDKPATFFGVAKSHALSADHQVVLSLCRFIDSNDGQKIWFISGDSDRLAYFERDDVNIDWRNIGGFGGGANDNTVVDNELFLFSTATSADGTTIRTFKNGVEFTIDPSGLEVGACNPVDAGIGCNSHAALDWNFNGMICEIAVYSSGLGDTERSRIETGLMQKWGIS
jgi:hypothetical protein